MRRARDVIAWVGAVGGCAILGIAACGRTGLIVDEQPTSAQDGAIEASEDAPEEHVGLDVGVDGRSDAGDAGGRDAGDAADARDARDASDALPPIDGAPPEGGVPCPDGGTVSAYVWSASGLLSTFDPVTVTTRPVGIVSCPTTAPSWTFSVSRAGTAYMMYQDWRIYRVDLATLACTATPYAPGQLGIGTQGALAVSRDPAAERLFVYAVDPATSQPELTVTDLSSFVLSPVGPVTPNPKVYPIDVQADAFGRLFILGQQGTFAEIDSTTGAVLAEDQTSFNDLSGGWAIMTYNDRIFFFGNSNGEVSEYHLATKTLTPLGAVNDSIVGASAAACIH
jgi:hypothetical protein